MYGRTEPIDDGRHRPTPGGPAPYPDSADAAPATGRHRARHQGPRRALTGPLALGAVVTVLLVMLGVGAAMLPANLTTGNDGSSPPPQPDAAAPLDDEGYGVLDRTAEPTAAPSTSAATSPSPSRTRATRAPATPRRSTAPASRATKRAATTSSGGGSADSREEQVVALVNQERATAGCGAVRINSQLATAARRHSQDQAANNTMSHTGSNGSSFVERARAAGYQNPIGENVAMGYRTPEAVMDGWMNSDGHRRNILNCQAKAIGVGVATASDGSLYWTQVFGATA